MGQRTTKIDKIKNTLGNIAFLIIATPLFVLLFILLMVVFILHEPMKWINRKIDKWDIFNKIFDWLENIEQRIK